MTPRSLSHRAPLLGLVLAWAVGSVLVHGGLVAWPAGVWAGLALAGLGLAWWGRWVMGNDRGGDTQRGPQSSAGILPADESAGVRLADEAMDDPPKPPPMPLGAAKGAKGWVVVVVGVGLALVAAGALRTGQERHRLVEWDTLALPPREARLTLRIERLFATPAEAPRAGGLAEIVAAEPHLQDLLGQRVQFSVAWPRGEGAAPALRGVEFAALGVLKRVPLQPDLASFDRFLADAGVNFSFGRARLEDSPSAASRWVRFCAVTGDRLEAILRTGLGGQERLADLHVAMMLGRQQELSDEQQALFVQSGTMHLFAISGLHIAGIALALNTLLIIMRVPGRARFVLGLGLLWGFVQVTGAAPSAVRAFWMVACLFGAQQLRAPGNSLAALVVSALGVLVVTPHQLFSASFQMSYGIVAAILLYGVPLQEKWLAGWTPWAHLPRAELGAWRVGLETIGRGLIGAVALGLAATLVSTPATLGFFNLMTPGGFFVNLVLIPLSTLVLFAGVAAILVGGVGLGWLASVFNHAAALILWAMEAAVAVATKIPGAAWPARFIWPWLATALGAGMLMLLAAGYVRGWRKRDGGYWMPFLILGVGLVLGVRAVSVGP